MTEKEKLAELHKAWHGATSISFGLWFFALLTGFAGAYGPMVCLLIAALIMYLEGNEFFREWKKGKEEQEAE